MGLSREQASVKIHKLCRIPTIAGAAWWEQLEVCTRQGCWPGLRSVQMVLLAVPAAQHQQKDQTMSPKM